jgi:hypothetical protein
MHAAPRTPFLLSVLVRQRYAAGFKVPPSGPFFAGRVNEPLAHSRGHKGREYASFA